MVRTYSCEVDCQLIPMREGVSPVVIRSREAESFVMLNGSRNIGYDEDRLYSDDTDDYVSGLRSLPSLERSFGLSALPFFERSVLVMQTEVPSREPPLDRSAECRTSAPAIGITRTDVAVRVVYARNDAGAHVGRSRIAVADGAEGFGRRSSRTNESGGDSSIGQVVSQRRRLRRSLRNRST
jgi:hypothetical protein